MKSIFCLPGILVSTFGLTVKAFCEPIPWNENWDGLNFCNASLKKGSGDKVPNIKRTFILVRHGQYVFASEDKKRVLTELGRKQAQATGARLSVLLEKGTLPPLESIFCSTMQRATETNTIISSELSLNSSFRIPSSQPCDLIREGAVCPPEPNTWHSPSEKDFEEDGARVEMAFQKYFKRSLHMGDANSTLFVCHGNVIRYFTMRLLQLPPEAWLRTAVANASITIINVFPNGHVSMRCMGETGHLSPELITFN